MTPVDISVAVADTARVGEGPFWDGGTGQLYWVDILAGAVNSYTPASGERSRIVLATMVGAAVPRAGGGLVAATREGFAEAGADGVWRTRLAMLADGHRMNDAKCDASGRLWSGSTQLEFHAGEGALHVLTPDWTCRTVLAGLTLPNGLDWSPDGRTFYLVDSIAAEVYAYDVTDDGLGLARRRTLVRFGEADGLPDGMAVDADGCLWIAMWGGSRVVRLDPEGEFIAAIPLPVKQPSSVAFGGPRLDVLFVTTAREGLEPTMITADALDGSVLAVRGHGATGRPATRFGG